MRVVNASEIRGIFAELLAEFGENYVYIKRRGSACLNWHKDENNPGCIIGWVMRKLGASDDLLASNLACGSNRLAAYVGEEQNLNFTPGALDLMAEVQELQDIEVPWGEAVRQGSSRASTYTFSGSTA